MAEIKTELSIGSAGCSKCVLSLFLGADLHNSSDQWGSELSRTLADYLGGLPCLVELVKLYSLPVT